MLAPPALFVHVPAQLLSTRLPFLRNRKLHPEVACQVIRLEKLNLDEMRSCARQLQEAGLQTSLHAPFNGFNPGSPKKRLQKKARQIVELSLELADTLNAGPIVFHPGLPLHPSQKELDQWQEQSLRFWPEYIEQAAQQDSCICIENIFETDPRMFLPLFEQLGGPNFGHCFDIGHWNIFARGELSEWFATLGSYINHLHLHDNLGQYDEHLPIGQGTVDFDQLYALIADLPQTPCMTLEAHTLTALDASLEAIRPHLQPSP